MMKSLQNDLIEVRKKVVFLLETKEKLTTVDINAINFIIQYLNELIQECGMGKLKQKNKRFPHLSRIVVDGGISSIDYQLGKSLIAVEKKYLDYF